MNWKYIYSSVKGTSHEAKNIPKQDSCKSCILMINGVDYLVSVVADGAGSAKYSDISSKFICKLFVNKTKRWLNDNKLETLTRDIISEWFVYFQKVINRTVSLYKLESVRDFATTLLFSILSKELNVFVQIGDGIIAIGNSTNMECVFFPQNGEFINTTNFATEKNAVNVFMYKTLNAPINRIAMHTDGIEQIALDFRLQKPHLPFFIPFFNAVEKLEECGFSEKLSQQLEIFLKSDRVNKKTDDDKTLFLASAVGIPESSLIFDELAILESPAVDNNAISEDSFVDEKPTTPDVLTKPDNPFLINNSINSTDSIIYETFKNSVTTEATNLTECDNE